MASEKDSGREMEVRSMSSDHGRWFEKDWRKEDVRRVKNERRAVVAIGFGWVVVGIDGCVAIVCRRK